MAILWDAKTYALVDRLSGHTGWVRGVAFSPDSKRLATTSWDQQAKVWDVDSGRELLSLAGHQGWSTGVAFAPGTADLATGSQDGAVRIWDVGDSQAALTNVHPGGVMSVAYQPGGKLFATAGMDGVLRIWDAATHQLLAEQGESGGLPINSVAFSLDGDQIVTAGDDRGCDPRRRQRRRNSGLAGSFQRRHCRHVQPRRKPGRHRQCGYLWPYIRHS